MKKRIDEWLTEYWLHIFLYGLLIVFALSIKIIIDSESSIPDEEINVIATVTKIEYKESESDTVMFLNPATGVTQIETDNSSEQYLVTVTYNGISSTLDDKELFESVKVLDNVEMILYSYKENGKIIQYGLKKP